VAYGKVWQEKYAIARTSSRLWDNPLFDVSAPVDDMTIDDQQSYNASYPERVSDLIDQLVTIDLRQGLDGNIDTNLLTENSDALCKHDLFDMIITKKMEITQSERVLESLRKVNSLLRGFISSERNVRSRLKVTYILAGAAENQLEYCIHMLSGRYSF